MNRLLAVAAALALAGSAHAAGNVEAGKSKAAQVCAACHGLKFVPIRTLADEGGPALPEDQVRAYATQFTVIPRLASSTACDLTNEIIAPLLAP